MTELAARSDLPQLTALWQQCFGDTLEEINRFWTALFEQLRVYVLREAGEAAAMLCAMPVTLVDESGEGHPCSYFYAVCTHPRFRRRGLCTRLLHEAQEQEAAHGAAFIALVPDGPDKLEFYRKRGYAPCLCHRRYPVSAAGRAKVTSLSPEGYQALRALQLYGAYVEYPLPLLRWQEKLGRHGGAGLYRIETEALVCCAAAERRGDTLLIKELLPDSAEAAAALAAALNVNGALVRTVADSGSESQPFGMLMAMGKQPLPVCAYLGLAFD